MSNNNFSGTLAPQDYHHQANVSNDDIHIHDIGNFKYLAIFLIIFFLSCGIFGNLLTIFVIFKSPKIKKSVSSKFITSLCVADALLCALNLPFMASNFVHGHWIHGKILCKIIPFIRYSNVGVSLLTIVAISVNRFILIAHPKIYIKIYEMKYVILMIISCWLFSFVLQIPVLFGIWGEFGYDPYISSCSILTLDGKNAKSSFFAIAFLFPSLIIITSYVGIFWAIRRSKNRLVKHGSVSKSTSDSLKKKKRKEGWKITCIGLVIYLSFAISYFPTFIMKMSNFDHEHPKIYVYMGYILLYFTACINPVIYAIMNRKYRKAYKTVLFCQKFDFNVKTNNNDKENGLQNNQIYQLRTLERLQLDNSEVSLTNQYLTDSVKVTDSDEDK